MDRATLQDNVRGKQTSVGEADDSTTPCLRRIPTASAADPHDCANSGDNRLSSAMGSPFYQPAMDAEWDDQSEMGESGISGRTPGRHRHDSLEAGTPTLIDEPDFVDEEEEQEMISYETERLMRNSSMLVSADNHHLRRTPGASMYRSNFQDSMRRTPGAQEMHKSVTNPETVAHDSGTGHASGLGFGLTLSSPVDPTRAKPVDLTSTWGSSLSTKGEGSEDRTSRPPLPRNAPPRDQRGALISPLNLNKVGSRQGAYSPHTLRLSEDLGNLLLDDIEAEGSEASGIFEVGSDTASVGVESVSDFKQEASESWTAPYVIHMDAPSRVARASTRGRRSKTEVSRRTRGHDKAVFGSRTFEDSTSGRVGGFLQYTQQPKALRSGQTEFFGHGDQLNMGFTDQYACQVLVEGSSGSSPSFLNFGGAFAPPSKSQTQNIGLQPVTTSSPSQPINSETFFQSQPAGQPAFAGDSGHFVASSFYDPFQQPGLPHFEDQQPVKFEPRFQQPVLLHLGQSAKFEHQYRQPGIPHYDADPAKFEPQFQQPGLPHFGVQPAKYEPQFQQAGLPQFDGQQFPKFEPQFQQPGLPHFGGQQLAKFEPQFVSQPFMFGSTHSAINPSPTYSMPPQCVVYPLHNVAMHVPSPQDFMPVMQHQQRHMAQYEQPQGQKWVASPTELQYDGSTQPTDHPGGWRHGGPGGWPLGEYGYAIQRTSDSPSLSMPATTPTWTQEDLVAADMNFYGAQQVQIGISPSPGPPGKGTKKNSRKNSKKPSKPQTRSDQSTPSSQVMLDKRSPIQKKNKKKPPKTNPVDSAPTPTEEIGASVPEDVGDTRRVDSDETPEAKAAFKEFSKKLRAEERSSFQAAQSYAFTALRDGELPESIHWKVYLELADLAKRANRFSEARNLYQKVCRLQPQAIQGWLEFSKLEEESGNMKVCAAILRAGIDHCEYNDGLFARAIKHEEKMGDISRARELLSRVKHMGIENVWRTVLEGALLEARSGNHVMARRVLKYLMHHVPWYGPLYLEAYKLEKNLGRSREALQVVERGLIAIPRYGPLWFGAFKLCEELDQSSQKYTLPQTTSMIDRSTLCVSKEIIWKVHLEAAQMLERCAVEFLDPATDPTAKAVLDMSRKRFARTILTCPPNLRWKVWLAAGRMEVAAGNTDRARALFLRAHQVVPDKGRAVALLECARLEEYVGDTELAAAILCKSRSVSGSDWKVWLESVLLEIRCGNKVRAIELASTALQLHSGTGRLWASLIQLYHYEEGEVKQFETLRHALNAVPKSGEVWCEAARVHLNPFSRTFNLPSARRHLSFATKFTPQYGDGFLETLRLEIIDQWLVPTAKLVWEMTRRLFDVSEEAHHWGGLIKYVGEISRAMFTICHDDYGEGTGDLAITAGLVSMVRNRLKPGFRDNTVDLSELCQRCANADPNYGLLWFHCREAPSGTARQIFKRATELMWNEIGSYAHVYLSALIRRLAILTQVDRQIEHRAKSKGGDEAPRNMGQTAPHEDLVMEAFLIAPSLQDILTTCDEKNDAKTRMVLLESTMPGSKFVSGLIALCDEVSLSAMTSSSEKRKALFGTDALFS